MNSGKATSRQVRLGKAFPFRQTPHPNYVISMLRNDMGDVAFSEGYGVESAVTRLVPLSFLKLSFSSESTTK